MSVLKNIVKKFYHLTLSSLTKKFGEVKATKIVYKIRMNKNLNLDNPQTFNEKIQWLKLFWQKKIIVESADKYLVREYVESKNLDYILNDLYQVCDSFEEINFKKLPDSFVIKTTNSCGTNLIVSDISELPDNNNLKNQINVWLKTDYGKQHIEPHYSLIKPRIIVEKYMSNGDGNLQDYKIFCFNGKPKFILIIDERDLNTGYKKRGYYSLDWEYVDIMEIPDHEKLKDAERPVKLKDMIEISKKLSEDFPFVRVDLYEVENKVVFGELTFTPHGGMANYYKKGIDNKIGDFLKLPDKTFIGYTE